MHIEFNTQSPKSKKSDTLIGEIQNNLIKGSHDEILVAVAYMTISGVRSLLSAFLQGPPKQSRWLIGLDDHITQPGAIELIASIPGSEVRIVSYSSLGYRFHPKVYVFNEGANSGFLVIGSSNLTAQALLSNGEANCIIKYSRKDDVGKINKLWNDLWSQGHKPGANEFLEYAKSYKKNKTKKQNTPTKKYFNSGMVILSSDDVELDPSKANICWIECGYITAQGREIELKAEQGLFFGLNPAGEDAKFFDFFVSSGDLVRLRMKYQKNHMWRLQLTAAVPEVRIGLRPTLQNGQLGRSPYAVVFSRTEIASKYNLSFVNLRSKEFSRLVKNSKSLGAFGETTARMYGWC